VQRIETLQKENNCTRKEEKWGENALSGSQKTQDGKNRYPPGITRWDRSPSPGVHGEGGVNAVFHAQKDKRGWNGTGPGEKNLGDGGTTRGTHERKTPGKKKGESEVKNGGGEEKEGEDTEGTQDEGQQEEGTWEGLLKKRK